MKPCHKYLICVALFSLVTVTAGMAQDDFDRFSRRSAADFDNFAVEADIRMAEVLRTTWEEMHMFGGAEKPLYPSPAVIPVAPGGEIYDREIIPSAALKAPSFNSPYGFEYTPPGSSLSAPGSATSTVAKDFSFCGVPLEIKVPAVARMTLAGTGENAVAEYWSGMSAAGYRGLAEEINILKQKLALGDWGFFMLVNDYFENEGFGENEKQVAVAFVLYCAGYDFLIGRTGGQLSLFLPVDETIYELPYLSRSGRTYYLASRHTGPKNEPIYVHGENTSSPRGRTFVMSNGARCFPDTGGRVEREAGALRIFYSAAAVQMYGRMPQCGLGVYFNTEFSRVLAMSLEEAFGGSMAGKEDYDKVSHLLTFIHGGLPYMEDHKQFGEERFFFAEECFSFPYSDCEDRAVLFARIVRQLAGLEVIGLVFDDHVAAAVAFTGDIRGDHVMWNGRKYTVCDPTYMSARPGQTMPGYEDSRPLVIPVN